MKSLLREFDEQAQKAIVVAESLSFDFGHQNVGSEHLLLSLLKIHDNQLKRLLQKYDVNDAAVEEDIKRLFGTNDDQPFYMEYSQSVKRILERSIEYAKDKNQDQVTLNILIISLLKEKESVAYEILQKYHVDVEEVIYLLQEKSAFETPLDQIPTLVNINKKVKTKKYKIIGRENEIDQVCTILSKKEKNNVLLIGKAGVILRAINFIVKNAVSTTYKKRIELSIDINGYKEERYKKVASMARKLGKQVLRTKADIKLDPMPADERKVMHQELAKLDHVKTQSYGEGKNRHMVISYVE